MILAGSKRASDQYGAYTFKQADGNLIKVQVCATQLHTQDHQEPTLQPMPQTTVSSHIDLPTYFPSSVCYGIFKYSVQSPKQNCLEGFW